MTSSKKIKIVKIIKQSYEFNTESQKTRRPVSLPSVSGGPCLDVLQKNYRGPKRGFTKKRRFISHVPKTCEIQRIKTEPTGHRRGPKQHRTRTKANRNRTEWKPKGGEAEPNKNPRGPKQNLTRTQGGTEAEPNGNQSGPKQNRKGTKPEQIGSRRGRSRTECEPKRTEKEPFPHQRSTSLEL